MLRFASGLTPAERANYDPEDLLLEMWVVLRERDSRWEPSRGEYKNFAGTVVDRALCDIRDRARVVHSPRNSLSRTREIKRAVEDGALTERQKKTAQDIERSHRAPHGIEAMGAIPDPVGTPHDAAAAMELASAARDEVARVIALLEFDEARAIGMLYGLWGGSPMRPIEVAKAMGVSVGRVASVHYAALAKIHKILARGGE